MDDLLEDNFESFVDGLVFGLKNNPLRARLEVRGDSVGVNKPTLEDSDFILLALVGIYNKQVIL